MNIRQLNRKNSQTKSQGVSGSVPLGTQTSRNIQSYKLQDHKQLQNLITLFQNHETPTPVSSTPTLLLIYSRPRHTPSCKRDNEGQHFEYAGVSVSHKRRAHQN
ncbi:hypothetical protein FRX31_006176 [Thalictrum thalictroides]|uniref:Uncharacterized protein n=1 Tax=Thalictrum thalictroides TaxID=46969 RepID=A0A7J6X5B2_THATH|nr:hypothetical protein FRX31_006176 [Thalictrum thalictroides]